MTTAMPTEKLDSKAILGDFVFKSMDEVAMCNVQECGYRTPTCPDCIGGVQDTESMLPCWPCMVNHGLRAVHGFKCKSPETCTRSGGFLCCLASACAFPPDESVPMGCGCCGMGAGSTEVTLDGLGLKYTEDTCPLMVCCCAHYACHTKFPECCGCHSSFETCCITGLGHAAIDPIEAVCAGRMSQFCVEQKCNQCPKPCYPFCMFQDEACCC